MFGSLDVGRIVEGGGAIFSFFIVPVRVRLKPRVKRHRLRGVFRVLLVLFVLAVVAEYWKPILVAAAVIAVLWFFFELLRGRAIRRDAPAETPKAALVLDSGEDRPSTPPLAEQFGSGVRGLSSAFVEGFRNGRRGG